VLSNADLAELLATHAGDETSSTRERALKRAARSAFLWPEEAAQLLSAGRSLTELHSVGPFVAHQLTSWIEDPPPRDEPRDPLREDFLTLAEAKVILARDPSWSPRLRGDLHLHTVWSDGSGTVQEMAQAGAEAGYEYIAITDHSKGLKIVPLPELQSWVSALRAAASR